VVSALAFVLAAWPASAQSPRELTIPQKQTIVYRLRFTPDGKYAAGLIARGAKSHIVFWDAKTGKEQNAFTYGGAGPGDLLAFSPDDKTMAVNWRFGTGKNNLFICTVELWDVEKKQTIREFATEEGEGGSGLFTSDGKTLILTSALGGAVLYDVQTGKRVAELTGKLTKTRFIALSADDKWLVTGSDSATVVVWDVAKRKEVRTLEYKFKGAKPSLSALCISPKGEWVAAAAYNDAVVWDRSTGKVTSEFKGHRHWLGTVSYLAFGDKSETVVVGGAGLFTGLRVWNFKSGAVSGCPERPKLKAPIMDHSAFALSHDRKLLVTYGQRQVRFYDLPTADEVNKAPHAKD
jgi:WD40 repeat protein